VRLRRIAIAIDAALRVESRYFTQILRSKEAAAMIRSLFLSMQELNKGARRRRVCRYQGQEARHHRRGFMGASVGYVSARAGIEVVLIDRDQESADKGKGHAKAVIDDLIKKAVPGRDRDAILSRISATADYEVLKDCDLIIEACSRIARSRRKPTPRRSRC